MTARLEMRGIAKSFSGVQVLDDVELVVAPGEVVSLLGANGAGKSTLMKILGGAYASDAGTIAIDGKACDVARPADAAAAGVSFLPQEISIIPDLSVAENIAITALPTKRFAGMTRVDHRRAAHEAALVLERLGFPELSPHAFVGDLPVAEQRIVEIARALTREASILIMDEPTASLSEQESEKIFAIVRTLAAQGTSIIYISHYLKEVFAISDRIEVLRDGRNAGDFLPADSSVEEVLEAMLGAAAGNLYPERPAPSEDRPPLLELSELRWRDRLDGVSLAVRPGEIAGVFGLVGSGVEVLGRVVFGALGHDHAGEMRFDGAPFSPRSPAHAKAAGVGFVTAERKKDGLLADLSVRENLVAPFEANFLAGPFVSRRRESRYARDWIERLGIRTSGPEQPIRFLSGGNQQKVCVARWLDPSVRLLVLEEPTRGVDVGARGELYRRLDEFARAGLAILVLSSDAEEVAGLCDRAYVIDHGRLVADFPEGSDAAGLMAATAGERSPRNTSVGRPSTPEPLPS